MARKINPNLDEGQSGNRNAVQLAMVRAGIRELIETGGGNRVYDPQIAKEIAERYYMHWTTVVKFAYGETEAPAKYTQSCMLKEVGLALYVGPANAKLPRGKGWARYE